MLGDFNAHYDVANPSGNSDVGGKLNSFLESNNLAQLIAEPTRVTFNSSTILDLVITNCRALVRFWNFKSPIQLRSLCHFRKYASFHSQKSVVQKARVQF